MRNRRAIPLLLAALFLFGACGGGQSEATCYALGTVCTQSIYGGRDLLSEGEKMIYAADARYSWRKPASEISKINAEAGSFVPVSRETFELVRRARDLAVLTNGAFDPTLGILTKEWNVSQSPKVPSSDEIEKALTYVDYGKIQLNEKESSVRIGKGQYLDLGAIAKGYVADELAGYYREKGVKSGLMNLGGNLYLLGEKPDGQGYRVGIRDPLSASQGYFCTLSAVDRAVVVSGAYERYFEQDGKVYHHILDPKTGYPAESDLLSSCIVAASSTEADALSTAVYVMGKERGLALIKQLEDVDALLVGKDGKIYMSEGFEQKYAVQWAEKMEYTKAG